MEPPDEGCVVFFVETLVASTDFNIPSAFKGKGRRNDSKGKIRQSKRKEKMLPRRTLEASLEAQVL